MLKNEGSSRKLFIYYILYILVSILIMTSYYWLSVRNHCVRKTVCVEGQSDGWFSVRDITIGQLRLSYDDEAENIQRRDSAGFSEVSIGIYDRQNSLIWEKKFSDIDIPVFSFGNAIDIEDMPIILQEGEYHLCTSCLPDHRNKVITERVYPITVLMTGEYQTIWKYYAQLCVISLLALSAAFFLATARGKYAYILYAVLMLLLGILINYVMKPLSVPDENAHFGYTYNRSSALLSRAHDIDSELPGIYMYQTGLVRTGYDNGMLQGTYDFWTDFSYGNYETEAINASYRADTNYVTYEYIPQVLFVSLARLCRMPYQFVFLMGRLGTLTSFVAVMYWCMYLCPELRKMIAAISLLPSVLWLAASFSYDAWNLGFSMLFVCACLSMSRDSRERSSSGRIIFLVAVYILFVPIKYVYFILGLLVFAALSGKRTDFRIMIVFGILVSCTVIAAFVLKGQEITALLTTPMTDSRGLEQGLFGEAYTIRWVLQNIPETVKVFLKTLFMVSDGLIKKIIAGEFNPQFIPDSTAIILLIVFLLNVVHTGEQLPYTIRTRAIAAVAMALGILIVFASFLFIYSYHVEGDISVISGVQGRYMLPYLILLPLLVPKKGPKENTAVNKPLLNCNLFLCRNEWLLPSAVSVLHILVLFSRFQGMLEKV